MNINDEVEDDYFMLPELKCIRKTLNFTSIQATDRFDKPTFNPKVFLNSLPYKSPSLVELIKNIASLDESDMKKDGHLYKHYIFSDIKQGNGAKIIASALIAAGYKLVVKPQGSALVVNEAVVSSNNSKKFALLSSTAVWETTPNINFTKKILEVYNERPGNIHGEKCRFIVLDSGFKEGVDLFDVKYAHIFEEQLTNSDLVQSIGRATRFCGQKGLEFGKKGWELKIFNYKNYVPRKYSSTNKGILQEIKESKPLLTFMFNLEDSLTDIIKDNAIDKALTVEIHKETAKHKSFVSKYKKTLTALTAAGILAASYMTWKKLKK